MGVGASHSCSLGTAACYLLVMLLTRTVLMTSLFQKAVDHADLVVYEMATVLQPAEDVGVSFIPSPENPFAHPTFLNTTGHGGAACTTPTACKGQEGRFGVSRANLRFGDGKERRSLTSPPALLTTAWMCSRTWRLCAVLNLVCVRGMCSDRRLNSRAGPPNDAYNACNFIY